LAQLVCIFSQLYIHYITVSYFFTPKNTTMRFSTTSLILAFAASIAVQATPIDDSNGALSQRSAELAAREILIIEEREAEANATEAKK